MLCDTVFYYFFLSGRAAFHADLHLLMFSSICLTGNVIGLFPFLFCYAAPYVALDGRLEIFPLAVT